MVKQWDEKQGVNPDVAERRRAQEGSAVMFSEY
jgi:hypothetical protein